MKSDENEDIFSTSEEMISGGEEVKQIRRDRSKRKKLSSGGSVDVSGLNELKEEVRGLKEFLKQIDGKLESLAELKVELSSVAKNVEKIGQKVGEIEKRCDTMEERVGEMEKRNQIAQDVLIMLEDRSIDQEARSRRNNLMFYGVREDDREDCMVMIKKMLKECCNIKDLVIERAHRTGGGSTGNPRPIIAKFLDFNDKMMVKKAKQRLPKHVRVGDDLPLAVREAQKQLYAECRAAREEGKDAFIAYPARLVVEGQQVDCVRPTLIRPSSHRDKVKARNIDKAERTGGSSNHDTNQTDSRDTRQQRQSEWQTAGGSRQYSNNRGAWRGRGNTTRGGRGGRGGR